MNLKNCVLIVCLAFTPVAIAQVKIGDNPTVINNSAVLEIESTNKGLLFPRVALVSSNSPAPLNAFVAGLTVYNTATAGTGSTAVKPGLYCSDGSKWLLISTTYNGSASIELNGNGFERAALTGDVTAATNSNTVTINNNAITSAKIADGTIVTADLSNNSVTSAKIVNGTINTADIGNNAVTTAKLAAGATATTFLRGDNTWAEIPYGRSKTITLILDPNETSEDVLSALNLPQSLYKITLYTANFCEAFNYHEFLGNLRDYNGYSAVRFTEGLTAQFFPNVNQIDQRTVILSPVEGSVPGCPGEGADGGLTYKIFYNSDNDGLFVQNLSSTECYYIITLIRLQPD